MTWPIRSLNATIPRLLLFNRKKLLFGQINYSIQFDISSRDHINHVTKFSTGQILFPQEWSFRIEIGIAFSN